MIKYENIRKQVIEIGVRMLHGNMVVGTWGNISARIPGEELMAITPSGVDYNTIESDGIVIMDFEGNVVDGNMKPSIEFSMHAVVYKDRKDINAIVHTHSEYATAFAIARKPIPAAAEDLVQITGGDVRVSEYKLPGTKELGDAVVEALKERTAALIANHGCIAGGRNLNEALKTAAIVEKGAKEAIFAHLLGGVVSLSKEDVDTMRDFYLNSYGQR